MERNVTSVVTMTYINKTTVSHMKDISHTDRAKLLQNSAYELILF